MASKEGGSIKPQSSDHRSQLQIQERPEFAQFFTSLEDDGDRRQPTVGERKELDQSLEALYVLFEDTGLSWQLDGAMNISLYAGDYIGVHKDIDISVEMNELPALDRVLSQRGYGLFLSHPRYTHQKRGQKYMERVDASGFAEVVEYADQGIHPMIAAVDSEGKIRFDAPLPMIDVHLLRRQDGVPIVGPYHLAAPNEWYEPRETVYKGRVFPCSPPAKIVYFKIHADPSQMRAYDQRDVRALIECIDLTDQDMEQIQHMLDTEQRSFQGDVQRLFEPVIVRLHPGMGEEEILSAFAQDVQLGYRVSGRKEQFLLLARFMVQNRSFLYPELEQELFSIFQLDDQYKPTLERWHEVQNWVHEKRAKEDRAR